MIKERTTSPLLATNRFYGEMIGIHYVAPGAQNRFACFVVLESNPLKIDPKKIKDIKIVATVMNGKLTYSKSKNSYSIGEETAE